MGSIWSRLVPFSQGSTKDVDLLPGVDLSLVQCAPEVVEPVRVGLVGEDGGRVVVLEGRLYGVRVVHEVQHEHPFLVGRGPVEPGKGLDGLDAPQGLVHVHGVQEGLVVARLELVGADEDSVGVLPDHLRNLVLDGNPFMDASLTRFPLWSRSPEKAIMARKGSPFSAGCTH